MVSTVESDDKSHLVEIYDRISGKRFLIDTGSQFSIIPPTHKERNQKDKATVSLVAANGTAIKTYGWKDIVLDLGLKRYYYFTVLIADVTRPLLGSDFLYHYGLTVDIRKSKIIDNKISAEQRTTPVLNSVKAVAMTAVLPENEYVAELLRKMPGLTNPNLAKKGEVKTKHHIETIGPPVYCRPRPMSKEKFEICQKLVKKNLESGICRRGSGRYASPAHIVPKGNSEWRLVGDYRRLNAQTVTDRYPVPCLRDFTRNLAGCNIFSKVDLLHAFHQIEMDESSIEKTAIALQNGLFEYLKLPMGLSNSGQSFQRVMDELFFEILFVFVYIDDLLIAS